MYVLVKQIGNDFEIMISRVLCVSMCVSFYWVKLVSDIWLIFYYIHFLFCILIFRKHTVALAPESGRVYAFGLGACGGGDHCFVLASTSNVSKENKFVKFPYSWI